MSAGAFRMKHRLLSIALLASFAVQADAHHSGAAFDRTRSVSVTGTVAAVEWTSPHARLLVKVKEAGGEEVTWDFELPSPVTLTRRGWSRTAINVGDSVAVTGSPAREFPHIAIATGVTDPKGRRLFSGSAASTE
jgi:hypothetical protein